MKSIAMVNGDAGFVFVFKIVELKFMGFLFELISSLIACFQPYVAMLNVEGAPPNKRHI